MSSLKTTWEERLLIINEIYKKLFFCWKREFLLNRQEEPGPQSLSGSGKGNRHPLGFNFFAASTVFRGCALCRVKIKSLYLRCK